MKINGQEMEAPRIDEMWRQNKIYLESAFLKTGVTNIVEFVVENQFNKDQFGFIRSKDADGHEYVFIQTVPYYASRILPMFDQPDLKGKFSIGVVHPDHDTCITTGVQKSSARLHDVIKEQKDPTWFATNTNSLRIEDDKAFLTTFESSPYLSSYLLNLVCGPFEVVEALPEQLCRNIPMRLFCRSMFSILLRIP